MPKNFFPITRKLHLLLNSAVITEAAPSPKILYIGGITIKFMCDNLGWVGGEKVAAECIF